MKKNREKRPEVHYDLPATADEAAQLGVNAILDNLDKFRCGEKSSFEAYFYLGHEIHKKEHDIFVASIEPASHPDIANAVLTNNGMTLYVHQIQYDEGNVHMYYLDQSMYQRRFAFFEV